MAGLRGILLHSPIGNPMVLFRGFPVRMYKPGTGPPIPDAAGRRRPRAAP
jgi:hypothetical protein